MSKTTKKDLIEEISQNINKNSKEKKVISDTKITEIVNLFLSSMKNSLIEGNTIELRGFGTFEVRERVGRKNSRNPKTGKIVQVEDHNIVYFRSGDDLRDGVYKIKK